MPLVGSSEITSHWHATKGPPKLPVQFKDMIEADNDNTQSLDKLQVGLALSPHTPKADGMGINQMWAENGLRAQAENGR